MKRYPYIVQMLENTWKLQNIFKIAIISVNKIEKDDTNIIYIFNLSLTKLLWDVHEFHC